MLPQIWPAVLTLGWILFAISAGEGVMALVALATEDGHAEEFGVSAAVTAVVAGGCVLTTRGRQFQLRFRDATLLTVVAWIMVPAFAALPLIAEPVNLSLVDAYFEMVSGITTTGATVMVGLDDTAKSVLLWRSFSQWIGGIGIIPLPALWLFSTSPLYLMGLQMLSGAMWACYEYATLLLLFETIRDEQRTAILTSYNLLNSLSIATGSVVGGLILRGVGPGAQGYLLLFLISSACRLCVVPLMWRVGEAPRRLVTMWMRPLAVRPSAGSVERPIVAAMDGDSDVEAL